MMHTFLFQSSLGVNKFLIVGKMGKLWLREKEKKQFILASKEFILEMKLLYVRLYP